MIKSDVILGLIQVYYVIIALVTLMTFDVITGLIKAFITKKLSSSASREGMARKAAILFAVATGAVFAPVVKATTGIDLPLATLIATGFCVTELISILENLDEVGVRVPTILRFSLKQVQDKMTEQEANTLSTTVTSVVHTESVAVTKQPIEGSQESKPIE